MLRRVVGWVCYDEDTWPERGSRMKARLEKALQLHQVAAWSKQVQDTKLKLLTEIQRGPMWTMGPSGMCCIEWRERSEAKRSTARSMLLKQHVLRLYVSYIYSCRTGLEFMCHPRRAP